MVRGLLHPAPTLRAAAVPRAPRPVPARAVLLEFVLPLATGLSWMAVGAVALAVARLEGLPPPERATFGSGLAWLVGLCLVAAGGIVFSWGLVRSTWWSRLQRHGRAADAVVTRVAAVPWLRVAGAGAPSISSWRSRTQPVRGASCACACIRPGAAATSSRENCCVVITRPPARSRRRCTGRHDGRAADGASEAADAAPGAPAGAPVGVQSLRVFAARQRGGTGVPLVRGPASGIIMAQERGEQSTGPPRGSRAGRRPLRLALVAGLGVLAAKMVSGCRPADPGQEGTNVTPTNLSYADSARFANERERMVAEQIVARGVRDIRWSSRPCGPCRATSSCPRSCARPPTATRRCRSATTRPSRSRTSSR